MLINFELSPADLEYFRKVMQTACDSCKTLTREQIIEKASEALAQVRRSSTSDFIRERMNQLDILINMLNDQRWDMSDDDSQRVLAALSYFSNPQGLIPDDLPVLGFLDDAIMVEIVCKELQHEMQAYQDFQDYLQEKMPSKQAADNQTASGSVDQANDEVNTINKSEWLEERRQQLHSRMRRRRDGQSDGKTSKSPFSLF